MIFCQSGDLVTLLRSQFLFRRRNDESVLQFSS